jgi:hypothetical protein
VQTEVIVHGNVIFTFSLQPLVSGGPMLYPGRCGVWQPVANSSSVQGVTGTMTELPKESIIANTDFTTTSLIAKRWVMKGRGLFTHLSGCWSYH